MLAARHSQDCRKVVEKNRKNALSNELAIKSADFDAKSDSPDSISYPLTRNDVAPLADGAAVVVLAADDAARSLREDPVWVKGVGWASDSPTLETGIGIRQPMRSWHLSKLTAKRKFMILLAKFNLQKSTTRTLTKNFNIRKRLD